MSPRASALRLITGLASACSRTPPEPAPAASTTPATTTASATPQSASAAPAARCVTALASAAPAIPKPAASCPADPEAPRPLPTAAVGFPDAAGSPRVDVELAMTPHDVEKGLMYRRAMPEEHGMLFKLQDRRDHTFWMQNTCIPLDMMFVDQDGLIVGIVEGAEPLTTAERAVGCPSVYVLEVNGGWSRRHGVRPGQRLGLPAVVR